MAGMKVNQRMGSHTRDLALSPSIVDNNPFKKKVAVGIILNLPDNVTPELMVWIGHQTQ